EEVQGHRHVAAGYQHLLLGRLLEEEVVDRHLVGAALRLLPYRPDVERRLHAELEGGVQEAEVGAADDLVEVAQGLLAVDRVDDPPLPRAEVAAGPGGAAGERHVVVDEEAADAAVLVQPAHPLHRQAYGVDGLGEDLLVRRQLRLEVEDTPLPEEEVADRVLDLPAQGLLDEVGGQELELGERLPQALAAGGTVGEGLEELMLGQESLQEQVLAAGLGEIGRQTGHHLAGMEIDPLLAVAPAHHQGSRPAVVLRPLDDGARWEGGKSSRKLHRFAFIVDLLCATVEECREVTRRGRLLMLASHAATASAS